MSKMSLENVQAVVVGLGLTGQSCLRFLTQQGAKVTAMDTRNDLVVAKQEGVKVLLGNFDAKVLMAAELILLSPGVNPNHPSLLAAKQAGVEIIGDVELFARFNSIPVIAITGSNGKSTVTSLICKLLQDAGLRAVMGGNIGTPVLELLEQSADVIILELSSFQLETTHSLTPLCATVLNISEDHLDRHLTLDAYVAAKLNIYANATYCISNRDDSLTWSNNYPNDRQFGLSSSEKGYYWQASTDSLVCDGKVLLHGKDCQLFGSHNMLNIQAALACIEPFSVSIESIKTTLGDFAGLPHRFETVSQYNNVRWINDSKATNVGATLAAIESLAYRGASKLLLIAGGDGKNADFSMLQATLLEHVDLLITLGKDGPQIAALKPGSVQVSSLTEAVNFASSLVKSGDIVLLSPACASLDMFKNYQHRGEVFANAVKELAA